MTAPRVSVITPVYNRSSLLIPTVRSVLAQTFVDFEYLLIDDGSTDDTPEVARGLAAEDARVAYHRRTNGGGAAARSVGLSLASGEYVAFLDHDDRWAPEKLEAQVRHLDSHPDDGVVFGRVRLVDQHGGAKGPLRVRYRHGRVQQALVVCQNFVGTYSNPMIRSRVLATVGGPDPTVGMSDDWDLFIRLAGETLFGFIDRELVLYNVGNEESQSRNMEAAIEAERAVLNKHRDLVARLAPPSKLRLAYNMRRRRAEMLRVTGWRAQAGGELGAAAGWYRAAARLHPAVFLRRHVLKDIASLLRQQRRTRTGR